MVEAPLELGVSASLWRLWSRASSTNRDTKYAFDIIF